jgi:Sec-independent protein translocase protein TatA
LNPANQLFKEEFGSSSNLKEAFENKCKEVRELKKLAYEYKEELDKTKDELNIQKMKYEVKEELNIKLQEKLCNNVLCENLIDL